MKPLARFVSGVCLPLCLPLVAGFAASRDTTAPLEGLRDASPRVHALVGARIVTAPDKVIEQGVLVIRDGVIEAVGADVTPPADARVWDVKGRTLFSAFIESDASLFLPAGWKPVTGGPPAARADDDAPRPPADAEATPGAAAANAEPPAGARAWNSRVLPQRLASRALTADPRGAEALRKLGFAVAHVTPGRGIFRGQSALVSLGSGGFNRTVLRESVLQPIAFETASPGEGAYPTALMGSIALVRQTLFDAQWYADAHARARNAAAGVARPEANDALAALGAVVRGEQPVMFSLRDELDPERAVRLASEFKLKFVLRGSGYEYRVLRALPEKRVPVIVPLAFPEAPEIEDPDHALDISLDRLEHWELAAGNAAQLATAGVPVIFTSAGLRRPDTEFWPNLRKTIQRGLPRATALAALTTAPAEILGLAGTHGTLAAGKVANVIVASGDLFSAEDAEIQLMWVDGEPFELEPWRRFDARGTWRVAWEGAKTGPAEIKITGRTPARLSASGGGSNATVRADGDHFTLLAPAKWFGLDAGTTRLSARREDATLHGTGELPDGTQVRWRAERTAAAEPPAAAPERKPETLHARTNVFPAGAYGRTAAPEQPAAVLVRGATIWTSAAAGTLERADLLIERGKITRVGPNLAAPSGATIIDATGKHVSPGLIDCHSHLAVARGINEASHSVTVEVRIGDVLDATDVGIYRCLAGGLTTANILHGSANSMGGQNAVIKLRWGEMAEGLKFAGAPPGVKFALGENVTRKNVTPASTRYPISRMGVREVMLDTFTRARDYERAWAEFRANRSPLPPRRDLRLEAALEILRGERLIHIHSYRQDEILAFIRLAEDLKLPVATFQHILEGYKVAPEIAKLGAGASSFSDWWNYKYEVVDAIPQNGALLRAAGVVVSFNSDSDELARRMNTEAAKAVKYGGVPAAEALKFVTINPAKQLRIARHVGSLEPGKDADFVIWNASPLSTYARVEQTWIDGRRYFEREEDARLRAEAATLRATLVQKILPARQRARAGGPGAGATGEGAGGAERPGILLLLEQLAAEHHGEMRGLYHDGGPTHNCSTHGGN